MDNIIRSAVKLSIISTPSKVNIRELLEYPPDVILDKMDEKKIVTQDYISVKYSKDPSTSVNKIIENCITKRIGIVTIWDSSYPKLLKEIHKPPIVLYVSGHIKNNRMISIVGTRKSDDVSDRIALKISGVAVQSGYTVVSGMALGIDRAAHLGAINSGGGTVAVLPGGVDMVYPSKNTDIYRMIMDSEDSCIISEFPPGTGTAQKWTFARRNRIISGLSEAVIVVQAPARSGAMITARYAIEQNRELLACPGNAFDEKYSGCNELIRQGAGIFSDIKDFFPERSNSSMETEPLNILSEKNLFKKKQSNENNLDIFIPENMSGIIEKNIFSELMNGPVDIDDFIRKNNHCVLDVNQAVTVLEITGYAVRRGGRLFKK